MKPISTILLSIALLLSIVSNVSAQAQSADNASAQIERLSQTVKSLGNYAVRFSVSVGEYNASGSYTVGDERYTMSLGNIEVYGEKGLRHDVDTSRKEIVIDKVDSSSHNILNNPMSAFDFIGEEFSAEIITESDEEVSLRLTPRQVTEQSGVIELSIDKRTNLPKALLYRLSSDSVKVVIDHIGATSIAPAKFDKSKFENFEIIDFR